VLNLVQDYEKEEHREAKTHVIFWGTFNNDHLELALLCSFLLHIKHTSVAHEMH